MPVAAFARGHFEWLAGEYTVVIVYMTGGAVGYRDSRIGIARGFGRKSNGKFCIIPRRLAVAGGATNQSVIAYQVKPGCCMIKCGFDETRDIKPSGRLMAIGTIGTKCTEMHVFVAIIARCKRNVDVLDKRRLARLFDGGMAPFTRYIKVFPG